MSAGPSIGVRALGWYVAGNMYAILRKDRYSIYRSWQAPMAGRAGLRIAVLKLDHVGDFWMALGPLRLLRRCFPTAHLTLITGHWNVAAAERLEVADEILPYDFFHRNPRQARRGQSEPAPIETLVTRPFDLAIDLRVPLETRSVLKAIPAYRKAAVADRYRMPWVDIAVPPLPVKVRWSLPFRITEHLRIPPAVRALVDPTYRRRRDNLQHVEEVLSYLVAKVATAFPAAGGGTGGPLPVAEGRDAIPAGPSRPIVVAPASNSELRDWPADRFGGLVARLARLGSPISILGRPDNADVLSATVASAMAAGAAASGMTVRSDLADQAFIDHLAGARLVVSNNSGTGHVAARLGVPTLGIYTASHLPDVWGFRGPRVSMLVSNIACGGCGLDRVRHCPQGVPCKYEIEPEDVGAEVDALLAADGTASPLPPVLQPA
jgi:ADP-heptose:LPS heptosyltransferase